MVLWQEKLDVGLKPDAKEYKAFEAKTSIFLLSGHDKEDWMRHRIGNEAAEFPMAHPHPINNIRDGRDLNSQAVIIYIPDFFTDNSDVVVFIQGSRNIAEFMMGAYCGRPYSGRSFCTLVRSNQLDLLSSGDVRPDSLEIVRKTDFRGLRHRYLFETALTAWSRVKVDDDSPLWHLALGRAAGHCDSEGLSCDSSATLAASTEDGSKENEEDKEEGYEYLRDEDEEMEMEMAMDIDEGF